MVDPCSVSCIFWGSEDPNCRELDVWIPKARHQRMRFSRAVVSVDDVTRWACCWSILPPEAWKSWRSSDTVWPWRSSGSVSVRRRLSSQAIRSRRRISRMRGKSSLQTMLTQRKRACIANCSWIWILDSLVSSAGWWEDEWRERLTQRSRTRMAHSSSAWRPFAFAASR